MTPTPPDTTIRYRVKYTGPFGTHAMLFHGQTGIALADLRGDVLDVLEQMKHVQYNTTVWTSAEFAPAGVDFFTPDPDFVAVTGADGGAAGANSGPSTFLQFGGRSSITGKRVKLYLFETVAQENPQMRIQASASAQIAAVITELNSEDCNIATIDGTLPTWYPYANVGQNDYLTHKARS